MQYDLPQADAALKTAFELSPPKSPKLLQYAQFKIKTGDSEAGKKILNQILKTIPNYIPAWMELANIAAAQTNYGDSVAFLSKVLARDPQNYDALTLDGELKLARGQVPEAITEFERLAKIYPQAPPVFYKLAIVYQANNDIKDAINSLNQAIDLNTNYTEAILFLAQIQITSGDFNAAITSLNRLIQQQPQLPQARLLLADALREESLRD